MLSCSARGTPPIYTALIRTSTVLVNTTNTATIRLYKDGNYTCQAINQYGTDVKELQINFKSKRFSSDVISLFLSNMVQYSAANDPRPQMIPIPEMIPKLDRKWSRTANDPSDPRRKVRNDMEFGFLDFSIFYFIFLFIYFHQLNNELDKHKEKIFWRYKLDWV